MEGWVHHEEAGRGTTASLDAARSLHERSDMQVSPHPRGRFARPGYAGLLKFDSSGLTAA